MVKQNSGRNVFYNTLQRSELSTKFCRINIFKQSLNNNEIKLYNNLPSHLKILKNIQLF